MFIHFVYEFKCITFKVVDLSDNFNIQLEIVQQFTSFRLKANLMKKKKQKKLMKGLKFLVTQRL